MRHYDYLAVRQSRMHRQTAPRRRGRMFAGLFTFIVLGILGVIFFTAHLQHHTSSPSGVPSYSSLAPVPKTAKAASVAAPKPGICVSNTVSQVVYISISQRHLWACAPTKQVYDSAVITGMENLPADLTPTGTYHIYAKQTSLYLNGSDSTGSWHDYVYYWMPFLSNQYGVYGFHDATWRKSDAFGNISPYSSDASHGCVELPLETAKWVYNWAAVGTTVIIQS